MPMSRSISTASSILPSEWKRIGMPASRAGLDDAVEMRPPQPLEPPRLDEQALVVGEIVGQEDDVHALGDRAADQLGEVVGRAGHQFVEQVGLLDQSSPCSRSRPMTNS